MQSKGHGLIEEVQVETSADKLHTTHGLLVLVKRKYGMVMVCCEGSAMFHLHILGLPTHEGNGLLCWRFRNMGEGRADLALPPQQKKFNRSVSQYLSTCATSSKEHKMICSQRHHRKERFSHSWVTVYLGWSEGGFLTSVQDGVVECDLQENLAVVASILVITHKYARLPEPGLLDKFAHKREVKHPFHRQLSAMVLSVFTVFAPRFCD